MRWVMLLGLWWALGAAPLDAQDAQEPESREPESRPEQSQSADPPEPDVHVDPETGDRYQLERPPEGAARGRWPVSAWVVWSVGGAVVLGASAVLIARIRRKR